MVLFPQKQVVLRRNPLFELDKLNREMSRFFEGHFPLKEDAENSLLGSYWSPAVDILDKKDKVVVKVDLPGLKRDDIDISIENNVLSIKGEKNEEVEHAEGEVVRSERYFGSFYRAFTLPVSVDAQKVNAKFEHGVLEIQILKKEDAKPKQIKIDVK